MALPIDFVDDTDGGYTPPPPPVYESTDWALIANMAGDVTGYVTGSVSSVLPGGVGDLNGTFPVTDVTDSVITLGAPETINPDWAELVGETSYGSPTLSTAGEAWVGPFVVDMTDADTLVLNVAAPQGMYYVTKKGKNRGWYVDVLFEATPVDAAGDPAGAPTTQTIRVRGDGEDKTARGITLEYALPLPGRYRVRARRTTPAESAAVKAAFGIKADDEGTVVDQVTWRDAYGTATIIENDFGDVTTIFSRTYATKQATAQKERKLNCRATRMVLVRNGDDTFGPALEATSNAASIICHMALDPYLGRRSVAELDVPQLFDTVQEVKDYFGVDAAGEFNYTFDQDNTSYEEMAQSVAQAIFCVLYRQGSVHRLFFEKATADSTLLFNHRNKKPGSETRTISFGNKDNNDGVEFDYVSPSDGSKLTVYIPADRSAVNPKKLEFIGVQDGQVAFLHAARAWNRIRYQHTTTEFQGLGEATQLVLNERIEVADDTRPDIFDGYIKGVDGLVLELSQPFTPADGIDYSIFIQLAAGGLDILPIIAGADEFHIVLQAPPSAAIIVDPDIAADVVYQITGSDNSRSTGFLLTEKGAYDKEALSVQAINYDDRYYQDDQTYNV